MATASLPPSDSTHRITAAGKKQFLFVEGFWKGTPLLLYKPDQHLHQHSIAPIFLFHLQCVLHNAAREPVQLALRTDTLYSGQLGW